MQQSYLKFLFSHFPSLSHFTATANTYPANTTTSRSNTTTSATKDMIVVAGDVGGGGVGVGDDSGTGNFAFVSDLL